MPLPVRFIFFLVGPHDSSEDYNETGRAFATIMSTPVSRESSESGRESGVNRELDLSRPGVDREPVQS